MGESGFKGKSMKMVAFDVSEGYITVNPLFLKKFDVDMIKELFEAMNKALTTIRNEKINYTDSFALRMRNMKLQRLHNATIILRNIAREKRIPL
ncbi:MAG TPA: hypothetical protein VK654_11350 [Nitrospirota bacterium]|nr:hypothetical protein [Nitrospirota bacterium]